MRYRDIPMVARPPKESRPIREKGKLRVTTFGATSLMTMTVSGFAGESLLKNENIVWCTAGKFKGWNDVVSILR